MKKGLFILLLPFMTLSSMASETLKSLVVWSKDSTKVAYALSENPKLTFTETDLLINSNGIEVAYELDKMLRLTYEDKVATEITSLNTNEPLFKINGDYLLFSLLKANSSIAIYALNGTLVLKKNIGEAGFYAFPLSVLGTGAYIVNVDGLTYKIIKK